jgi:hypothetical protein
MKRTQNRTALKFKFLPATNNKNARYKITQTNSNKSIIVSSNFYDKIPLEYFCNILESIDCINTFSLIVDNTQNDYYLFSVDVVGHSFDDLLTFFAAKK